MSQIDTENDQRHKVFLFQSFYAFFVNFLKNFVDLNVLMGLQGKDWLSSKLL